MDFAGDIDKLLNTLLKLLYDFLTYIEDDLERNQCMGFKDCSLEAGE
jgi:hypothetical protein